MLRTAARSSLLPLRAAQHAQQRSFVSTVLLSKTHEDKTVAELRTELRARGLSVYVQRLHVFSRDRTHSLLSSLFKAYLSRTDAYLCFRSQLWQVRQQNEVDPANSAGGCS